MGNVDWKWAAIGAVFALFILPLIFGLLRKV